MATSGNIKTVIILIRIKKAEALGKLQNEEHFQESYFNCDFDLKVSLL